VHSGLPREGPGSAACTGRALDMAGRLPATPRVLDIACGPGMQTMDLARLLPGSRIVALDNHMPFLEEVGRRAEARGVAERIEIVLGDMRSLSFPPASFDLLWCEGAAYMMGLAQALRAWRPMLAPAGRLALSEAVWLRPDAPEAVRRCWSDDYPAMGDIASRRAIVAECGYRLLGDFVLPPQAWWDDYYTPMQARLRQLAPRYAENAAPTAVLRACQEEIDAHARFSDWYGYVFLVMSKD